MVLDSVLSCVTFSVQLEGLKLLLQCSHLSSSLDLGKKYSSDDVVGSYDSAHGPCGKLV